MIRALPVKTLRAMIASRMRWASKSPSGRFFFSLRAAAARSELARRARATVRA